MLKMTDTGPGLANGGLYASTYGSNTYDYGPRYQQGYYRSADYGYGGPSFGVGFGVGYPGYYDYAGFGYPGYSYGAYAPGFGVGFGHPELYATGGYGGCGCGNGWWR
jgi:hypothetical protein